MKTYLKLIPIVLLTLLVSCESSVNDASKLEEPVTDEIKILAENGFPEHLIEEMETFYLIDGDMIISKAQVSDFINSTRGKQNDNKSTKQAYGGSGWGLVHINSVDYITIAPESNVPSSWNTALQNAVNNWNNISTSRITFNYQSTVSNQDIIVSYLPLSDDFAAADPAYDGDTGSYVYINSNPPSSLSSLEQIEIITHELGHTIGLRHTDWQNEEEISASTIPFTPNTDPESVMNSGGVELREWDGFSHYDNIASRVLYPNSLSAPGFQGTYVSETSNSMSIDIQPHYEYAPYIEVYSKGENESYWNKIDNINYPDNSKVVNAPIPSGYGEGDIISIRIRARGFQNGLASPYSYKMDFVIEGDGGSGGCVPGFPCEN